MSLCIYACFMEFYFFILDEINVGGPKLVYKYIWAGIVRENIPKDYQRVLEEGPQLVTKTAQDSPPTDGNRYLVGHWTPHCVVSSIETYLWERRDQREASVPDHRRKGWFVGQGTGCRWSIRPLGISLPWPL